MAERSKLSALLRGIQDAVQSSIDVAGQQTIALIKAFSTTGDDGTLTPKTLTIRLGQQQIEVPVLSMINPSAYRIDELDVEMSVRLSLDEVKRAISDERMTSYNAQRGSYNVELCPKTSVTARRQTDVVDVKMKFKAVDPAEGAMRILEMLNNGIAPRKVDPPSPPPENPSHDAYTPPEGNGQALPDREGASVCHDAPITPFTGVRGTAPELGRGDDPAGS